MLWLDEPRLHDPSLYLPSLPPPYDAARLETLLKPELVHRRLNFFRFGVNQILAHRGTSAFDLVVSLHRIVVDTL